MKTCEELDAELERVRMLHADALLGWAAERARAEKLREALIQIRLGGLTSNQCQTIADEALAATEVKP